MATKPPANELRDVDAIRRDLSTAEGQGGAQRLSPIGRLVADVEPLLDILAAGSRENAELRHDLRQEIASANELHARLEAARALVARWSQRPYPKGAEATIADVVADFAGVLPPPRIGMDVRAVYSESLRRLGRADLDPGGPARNRCTCERAAEGAAFHLPACPSYVD